MCNEIEVQLILQYRHMCLLGSATQAGVVREHVPP
jgi:hypothetical protein